MLAGGPERRSRIYPPPENRLVVATEYEDSDQTNRRRRAFGPGLLVAAAFVGPGTVATASRAGAEFGYALIWGLVFSVSATIVLQEMSVRTALVADRGLSAMLREALGRTVFGRAVLVLVVLAIGGGNAAYESGNIAGAAFALGSISELPVAAWAAVIGAMAAALLFLPAYRYLERVLIGLVLVMSAVFIASALFLAPDWPALLRGLRPAIPSGSTITLIALIGTTVVPYNLFLQANAARERWSGSADRDRALSEARTDTVLAVSLGGVVTLAILSTSATAFYLSATPFSSEALLRQLDPALGPAGRYVFITGLWAAGLTSAVTAPLAAAYAVSGALGLPEHLAGRSFRAIALAIVAIGTVFAATDGRPLSLIVFAQAANGLLLPLIAAVLLWLMNQRQFLGAARNGTLSNVAGGAVVFVTLGLGAYKLWSLL